MYSAQERGVRFVIMRALGRPDARTVLFSVQGIMKYKAKIVEEQAKVILEGGG